MRASRPPAAPLTRSSTRRSATATSNARSRYPHCRSSVSGVWCALSHAFNVSSHSRIREQVPTKSSRAVSSSWKNVSLYLGRDDGFVNRFDQETREIFDDDPDADPDIYGREIAVVRRNSS